MPQLPQAHRPLTERQLSTLDFMRSSHAATAQWPNIKQIAEHFGVSRGTVRHRLHVLVAKGAVSHEGDKTPYVALDMSLSIEGGASST